MQPRISRGRYGYSCFMSKQNGNDFGGLGFRDKRRAARLQKKVHTRKHRVLDKAIIAEAVNELEACDFRPPRLAQVPTQPARISYGLHDRVRRLKAA